jgi:hypothetical protein
MRNRSTTGWQPWTIGELCKVLEGVPDDFPARVFVAEEPAATRPTNRS